MPTNGFATKPLKVKLLAGEQKATEYIYIYIYTNSLVVCLHLRHILDDYIMPVLGSGKAPEQRLSETRPAPSTSTGQKSGGALLGVFFA